MIDRAVRLVIGGGGAVGLRHVLETMAAETMASETMAAETMASETMAAETMASHTTTMAAATSG